MNDARSGRHDPQIAKRPLRPPEKAVPFAVALVIALHVEAQRVGDAEHVDLHRVVDNEIDEDVGVDASGVAAHARHLGPQGRQVGDDGDARKILQQHPRRQVGQLDLRILGWPPAGERLDIGSGDDLAIAAPEHVLEQHFDREREPRHIRDARLRQTAEPVVGDGAAISFEPGQRSERIVCCHRMFLALGSSSLVVEGRGRLLRYTCNIRRVDTRRTATGHGVRASCAASASGVVAGSAHT